MCAQSSPCSYVYFDGVYIRNSGPYEFDDDDDDDDDADDDDDDDDEDDDEWKN